MIGEDAVGDALVALADFGEHRLDCKLKFREVVPINERFDLLERERRVSTAHADEQRPKSCEVWRGPEADLAAVDDKHFPEAVFRLGVVV